MPHQSSGQPNATDSAVAAHTAQSNREWSVPMFEASARARGSDATDHLLGVFDVLHDVINRADRPARAFLVRLGRVSTALPDNDADRSLVVDLRALITTLVVEAKVANREELLLSWWVLMRGSVLKALDGDHGSAHRARTMAVDLIDRHRTRLTYSPVAESSPEGIDFDAYFDDAFAAAAER